MTLSIPCLWKKVESNESEEQTKFGYSFGSNTLSEILNIKTMPGTPTKKEKDEIFSQKGLTQICNGLGTFISVKKTEINGLSCGQIEFKSVYQFPKSKIYLYSLQYYFIIKNKMIIVGYSAGSPKEKDSKKIYASYKALFQTLSKKTIFLEK